MKRIHRITAAMLACCFAVMSGSGCKTSIEANAVDAQALEYCEVVINTVNDIRVANGLRELATTPLLLEVGETRAVELAELFDHYRPDGSTCFTALKSAGLTYSYAAENIAAGRSDAVATVQQWMQSDGHRANILGEAYTHIAIGYYSDPNSVYGYHWEMFLIGVYDGTEPYIYDDQYIPTRELGDVNGTKSINAADANVILQYSASTAAGVNHPVVRAFKNAGDINADESIDSIDASIILSYAAARGSGENVELTDFVW